MFHRTPLENIWTITMYFDILYTNVIKRQINIAKMNNETVSGEWAVSHRFCRWAHLWSCCCSRTQTLKMFTIYLFDFTLGNVDTKDYSITKYGHSSDWTKTDRFISKPPWLLCASAPGSPSTDLPTWQRFWRSSASV